MMILLEIKRVAISLYSKIRSARLLIAIVIVVFLILLNNNQTVSKQLSIFSVNINSLILYTLSSPKKLIDFLNEYLGITVNIQLLELQEENMMLKEEIMSLKLENLELKSLSSQLGFNKQKFSALYSTRVMRGSLSMLDKSLIIQMGFMDGITNQSYITSAYGLIGKVSDVGLYSSKIKVITTPHHKTPAISSASRQKMVLIGSKQNNDVMEIVYCNNQAALQDAEVVITSGDGGVYPYGIPVGVIKHSDEKILVLPLFDIYNIEFVRVSK